ncbi:ferrous iron transport protein B [Bythopirellula polymerisocia]|uniref:Ferrous iron transport protein B n=1 Tax=Bythopirellula polymerisocia TaxID=2528003 RepID=A0A5C6CYX3_9BACT|nr:ferrous iron transport protein B [Bythopirellula polymerisocia]TWU28196.1 Ferrous iron transport protein B [Bythopirellula polymerisocia]
MSSTVSLSTLRIALVGNPNTGKSTLFNALAGINQRVGNYPGVTVEKKVGRFKNVEQTFEIIDLPGTYSLAPRSPDEMVAVDVLLGRGSGMSPPDIVLSIIDAANLQRNLYLVSQVLSCGLPTVIALNMVDVAAERGIEMDVATLSERLGVPVIPIQANRGQGLDELKTALIKAATQSTPPDHDPFPPVFRQHADQLANELNRDRAESLPRYLVGRLILDNNGYLEHQLLPSETPGQREQLAAIRQSLAAKGLPVPAVEAISRYEWVAKILDGIVHIPDERHLTVSDGIDHVLTNKVWGTLVLLAVMALLFSSIFVLAEPAMNVVDDGVGWLGDSVSSLLPEGALRSLIVDGIIGGVGAVVIFLPQILILFAFIAVLEDCGYMARAAYLMDRLMAGVGLSGRSFIPLLSSFACAVPGIMATRVIENRRDRLATILIAPLMSCSARLPVYVILIGAFVPAHTYFGGIVGLRGLTLLAMYLVGIIVAVVVAWLLKKTLLRGETPPFVLELPSYKLPSLRTVFFRMKERGWDFLQRAGTVIFAVTIVVWALAYYPRNEAQVAEMVAAERSELESQATATQPGTPDYDRAQQSLAEFDQRENLDHLAASLHQQQSFLGRAGQFIEPAVRPLGWDWRIGCAAIASFPAREVVMGVLGVIYNLGSDLDVGSEGDQSRLQERLQAARWDDTGERVYNLPVALSLMVFFALCAQCAATLAVIRRETNSWRWPVFTFTYMTMLAYVGALATYQITSRLWL